VFRRKIRKMPNYVFECKKCGKVYEELTRYDESGKYADVKCPDCGSAKKDKLMTACYFQFAQPEGTDRWNSDSTGHDYRYKSKQKSIRKEREAAEKASHMGSSEEIYRPINDLDKGNPFDFSKV
jgi:putative FmdB family regulatory protein